MFYQRITPYLYFSLHHKYWTAYVEKNAFSLAAPVIWNVLYVMKFNFTRGLSSRNINSKPIYKQQFPLF